MRRSLHKYRNKMKLFLLPTSPRNPHLLILLLFLLVLVLLGVLVLGRGRRRRRGRLLILLHGNTGGFTKHYRLYDMHMTSYALP